MQRDWTPKQPALDFEREHQLSEIAGTYEFSTEPGLDRLSMQNKIWDHYDTLRDPAILGERVKQFGTALGNPAITPSEISGNENLAHAFATFIQQREHDELTHMLGALEARNPEQIAKIRFNRADTKELSDVIHGIVSGYNPDDINHYLNRFNSGMCLNDLERTAPEIERRTLESNILQKLGQSTKRTLGWVASPQTLEKIWEQVKDRPLQALEQGIEKAVQAATRMHL